MTKETQVHHLYAYTDKALKLGCNPDYIFFIAENVPRHVEHFSEGLIAWKGTVTKQGVQHPAYRNLLSVRDIEKGRGFAYSARNKTEPEHEIYKDALYRPLSIGQLSTMILEAKIDSMSYVRSQQARIIQRAIPKLTLEERQAIAAVIGNAYLAANLVPEWFK